MHLSVYDEVTKKELPVYIGDSIYIHKYEFISQNDSVKIDSTTLSKKIKEHNQNGVNSLFLSNHDQSRSAGYYSLEKQKLAASVYLLSDGIPFIYYGEEIGLRGSGKDENKRLPMLWGESNDTKGPKDSDYTSQIDTSIKIQQQDKDSLLNHYKKIINLRKKYVANKKSEEYLIDNDNLFVLNYEGSIVIINFSDSDISIESSLKLLDKVDVLSTSKQKGTTLTIGGYGVVILRGE